MVLFQKLVLKESPQSVNQKCMRNTQYFFELYSKRWCCFLLLQKHLTKGFNEGGLAQETKLGRGKMVKVLESCIPSVERHKVV